MIRFAIALLVYLSACCPTKEKGPTTYSGVAMTIPYQILVDNSLNAKKVEALIAEVFNEVDQIYNNWNPTSELSKLNRLQANQVATLSDQLASFLAQVDQLVHVTKGRFDPTVAPLQAVWKNSLKRGSVPTQEEIAAIAPAIGWHHVHLDGKKFSKDLDEVAIDLCAVSKGYCVDLLLQRLQAAGCHNAFVCWGGEIAAIGHHPTGRSWTAAISSPGGNEIMGTVDLSGRAVATSGNYEQYWVTDDQTTYTHICNPSTLQAVQVGKQTAVSVTVAAPHCWLADGLATSLMIASDREEADQLTQLFENQFPNTAFFLIY